MPYYVPINGREVRCDTADEVFALTGGQKSASSQVVRAPTVAESSPAQTARQQKMVKQSLTFLEAIKHAGQGGIGGDKLVKKVGCDGPSGMGTVVQNLSRFLRPRLKKDDVAVRKRSGNEKVWRPGPKIDAGIAALKGKLDQLSNGVTK